MLLRPPYGRLRFKLRSAVYKANALSVVLLLWPHGASCHACRMTGTARHRVLLLLCQRALKLLISLKTAQMGMWLRKRNVVNPATQLYIRGAALHRQVGLCHCVCGTVWSALAGLDSYTPPPSLFFQVSAIGGEFRAPTDEATRKGRN